jgi:hypothetical protein
MKGREVGKAIGFMLLGSLITIMLFVLWVSLTFPGGFPR